MGKKVFIAKLSQLHEMVDFIKGYGTLHQIPPSTLSQIILASEEALVNVISYGYPLEIPRTLEIECSESSSRKGIKIVLKDCGIPFNPLDHIPATLPSANRLLDKTNHTVGGYGIYLMTCIMDSVEYQRVGGENILTLTKYFP